MAQPDKSTFPSDQNRWDRRDFVSQESSFENDDELEKVIKELLHNSKKVDASDITVTVHHRDVTLSGSVRSQEERDNASEIVKLVQGVGEVQVDLIVNLNQGILPTSFGRNP